MHSRGSNQSAVCSQKPHLARHVADPYSRWCLTIIAGLLAAVVLLMWAGPASLAQPGQAAPAVEERITVQQAILQTNERLDKTNQKLDKIITLMESGKIKVQTVTADEPKPEEPKKTK